MAKTNFNINKTDVYYTLINNEVYALRFKALLVDILLLSERELYFNESDKEMGVLSRGNKMYPYQLNNSKMVLFDHFRRFFELLKSNSRIKADRNTLLRIKKES